MKFFGMQTNAEKMQKTRKNTRKTQKILRKIADSEIFFADVVHCGWNPCGHNALWTQIICPPQLRSGDKLQKRASDMTNSYLTTTCPLFPIV